MNEVLKGNNLMKVKAKPKYQAGIMPAFSIFLSSFSWQGKQYAKYLFAEWINQWMTFSIQGRIDWIQIEVDCGSTKAKHKYSQWKFSEVMSKCFPRHVWGVYQLEQHMQRSGGKIWCSEVHTESQLMNWGDCEAHMKPIGLWLLEEQYFYRKSPCDILSSLEVQQISLLGGKSYNSSLQ